MRLVSTASVPLFAFASDGTVAWLRESGSRLVAVDTRSGEVLREVRLDPSPFGIGWRVERHGTFFVVRDDHEIAGYDDASGSRLWKRTWPRKVAFVGEREGRHVSVVPAADEAGEGAAIEIALADLATGDLQPKLRVDGTMKHVGAHGTLAGDLLFFATDQRDVFAIDLTRWRVARRVRMGGSHLLPPVSSASGVHVAAVERRESGSVTHVTTLDRMTGLVVSSTTLPGAAHRLAAGESGLVVEARRSPQGPVERIAFRPETPSVRLTVAKHADVRLVRTDAPRLRAPRPGARGGELEARRTTIAAAGLSVHDAPVAIEEGRGGRHPQMVPAPRDGSEGSSPTSRDGILGMLALLDARSDVLVRLADAYETRTGTVARLQRLGITLRDPRARWSSLIGRDPCLLDLAENREGDAVATYLYPQAASERVAVVLVSRATGEARWLADDFDVWFAGVLHDASGHAPDAVQRVLEDLGLGLDFPRPLGSAIPPPWFFEAHATPWTEADADAALAAGDVEGAERMLVAVGRAAGTDTPRLAAVKQRLAAVYTTLGWEHHRATVVETW